MTTVFRPDVVDELKRLAADGDLTPRRVVEEARNPKSPLHGEFNWDVAEAAQQYWEWQARKLIERFHVYVRTVATAEPISVQVFVRDPLRAPMEQGYVEVTRMTREQALASLAEELARIAGHVRRAWGLATEWKLRRELLRGLDKIRASLK